MTKTTAPRVRALNLYTVESNGQPVAQAMAISQAEAVALWVASQQQPTLSARMSSPLEARTLAGLPLLQREPVAVDTRTADLFGDAPMVADISTDAAEHLQACGVNIVAADHVEEARAMVPEVAAAPLWESLPVSAAAPASPAPVADARSGTADGGQRGAEVAPAPAAQASDEAPTQAERMASAYAAGVEIARQGHTRWSAEFLDANAAALRGLRDAAADEVHAEMLRGFENGQPIPRKPELKQQAEAAQRRAMGGKPVALYSNTDGQTWTGRGLKPKWLLAALEVGRTQDEFLIDTNGAQA